MPTLKRMWDPGGQQVMIGTPGQATRRYGIGAVDDHTGETVVLVRRHKRTGEIAELLEALVGKHTTGTVCVAWDSVSTHQDDEIEAVVRAAAGPACPAVPADLQPMAEPHRDAPVPPPARGDPLRTVRERRCSRGRRV